MLLARFSSWLVWAAVALSAVGWGLRWTSASTSALPRAELAGRGLTTGGDMSRLFGVTPASTLPAAPAAQERFKLLGVVAPRSVGGHPGRQGLALIAVDGQPPKAWRVGAAVDERWTLLAVRHRQADLGPAGGAVALTLELPPLAEAARGQPAAYGAPTLPMLRPNEAGAATPGLPPPQPGAFFGRPGGAFVNPPGSAMVLPGVLPNFAAGAAMPQQPPEPVQNEPDGATTQ
jgi:general secretion pathway protein C